MFRNPTPMLRTRLLLLGLVGMASAFQTTVYAKRNSGYCENGWQYIDSAEECAQAAVSVGTKCQDCEGGHLPEARDDRPKGCRAHIGDYCCAHWNTHPDPTPVREPDTPEHTGGWAAVCKKIDAGEL